jgi:hypothetical protein
MKFIFILSFFILLNILHSFLFKLYLNKNFNILKFYYLKKNLFTYHNNANYTSNIKTCTTDKECDYPDICCVNYCCSASFVNILIPKPKPVPIFNNS